MTPQHASRSIVPREPKICEEASEKKQVLILDWAIAHDCHPVTVNTALRQDVTQVCQDWLELNVLSLTSS
jgi:hypothetical protein